MLRVLLFWLPLSVAVAYGLASLTGQAAAVVVGLTLLGLAVLLALFWPALRYQYFTYSVREQDLLV